MLLLRTVHGSRLYGLHHENSDYDYWEVHSNTPKSKARNIKQKIDGDQDSVEMDLSTMSEYAQRSSHQVLEMIFSEKKEFCLIDSYCDNFVVNLTTMRDLYFRTVENFWLKAWQSEGRLRTKTFRHCVRMAINLEEAQRLGRFNPTLSESTVEAMVNSTDVELEKWMTRLMDRV